MKYPLTYANITMQTKDDSYITLLWNGPWALPPWKTSWKLLYETPYQQKKDKCKLEGSGYAGSLKRALKQRCSLKKICSYRKIPLQSFMTSFYPVPRWKNMQRPKPTAHGKRMGKRMSKRMSAGIKWEGTSTFKRFLKKKIILFRLALGSTSSFRKRCNG